MGNMTLFIAGIAILSLGTYLMRLGGAKLGNRLAFSERSQALLSDAATVLLFSVALATTFYEGAHFAGMARVLGVAFAVPANTLLRGGPAAASPAARHSARRPAPERYGSRPQSPAPRPPAVAVSARSPAAESRTRRRSTRPCWQAMRRQSTRSPHTPRSPAGDSSAGRQGPGAP